MSMSQLIQRSASRVAAWFSKRGAEGDRWTVYPYPGGSAHVDTATFDALRRALTPKTKATLHWKSGFAQLWLLLLNYYGHADCDDVKSFIQGLPRHRPAVRQIDGVLWRSGLEGSRIEIPLQVFVTSSSLRLPLCLDFNDSIDLRVAAIDNTLRMCHTNSAVGRASLTVR